MAHFTINFKNYKNEVIDTVSLIGRKIPNNNTHYVNYYVSKPNKYGIKWVSKTDNPNCASYWDISVNGKGEKLSYSFLTVTY